MAEEPWLAEGDRLRAACAVSRLEIIVHLRLKRL
jgi:hypothetical protein